MVTLGFLSACGGGDDVPGAPSQLAGVAGDGQATLTWTAASDADSYNLYWSNTAGVTPHTGTKIAGVTSPYDHTGLTNGLTYYYVVTASNGEGEGSPSNEASVTLAPSAPTTLSAVSGDHQVTVDWRGTLGTTSHNLYWSNSPGVTPGTGTKIEGVTAPFVHTGLTNGSTYYYVVTGVGAGGESLASEQVSAMPQVPVPGAPQSLAAVLTPETTKSVTLQWSPPLPPTDPADVLSYNLYRSTTPGIDVSTADKFEGVVSPHIDVVPAGQVTYYYVVTAVTAGGEGPVSAEVSATPRGSPGTGGGGGGDTGFGNNLSTPLVFADGIGLLGGVITGTDHTDLATGLRPTATDVTDPFPYFNVADIHTVGGVDYYQQQTSSTWQASWLNGKAATQNVEVDWGDNLTSAALSPNQVIRVETVLRQYPGGTSWPATETMLAYPMTFLYGQGINEMQGTVGTTVDATERRVYTVTARLKIQKLVNGVPTDHACGFNGSIAEGLAVPDGSQVPKYSSEINVGGSLTYGFNWRLNQCTAGDKAGTYRITFSLDDTATVGGTDYTNNVLLESLHSSETTSTLVDSKTTYIDIGVN
ncbi:fibronectin type III domain-containing protein [uncultured Piscinibacter sp.]|uniref:fibronectin type III domain-containing protein n=1 Tax=uncultured Piscinibacter sp. TaxID=1131835 RepID=UPI00260311C6|nr:fibronectin type III domain-containing protein [uncultured Piscinibacter sp.]